MAGLGHTSMQAGLSELLDHCTVMLLIVGKAWKCKSLSLSSSGILDRFLALVLPLLYWLNNRVVLNVIYFASAEY